MFRIFVLLMSISSTLAMINYRMFDSFLLRMIVYVLMFIYVCVILLYTYKNVPKFYRNRKFLLLVILLTLNMLVSPYDPLYSRLIKYLGYVGSFAFGYVLCKKGIPLKCRKLEMFLLVVLPLILVGLFDASPHKTNFFQLSNTYSFLGLCCSLFLYTVYNNKKNILYISIGLLFLYIISASSLGILTSVLLAVIIINCKKIKLIVPLFIIGGIVAVLIAKVDLPIFLRIRDVMNIATSLSWDEWTNLKDMDLYKTSLQFDMQSNRDDNTSFLWRLAHWQYIFDGFFDRWWYAIPFGLGDCYSVKMCGNYCHNEYIKFLTENGVVVFYILFTWILKAHKVLKEKQVYYFILAAFCYHLTENLIDTFVACVLLYFCIGYWMKRTELEKQLIRSH